MPRLIIAVGVAAAVVMGWLGLWQAQVFASQGKSAAAAITGEPVATLDGSVVGDGVNRLWGRTVTVSGRYLPAQQVLVVGEDGTGRVLTAFQLADGRVVAIARGVGSGAEAPPNGDITQTGVFLPTEAASDWTVPSGAYGSVRLQALAQVWPQPVVSGYVTLDAAEAAAQGLRPAAVVLPQLDGQFRNAGYALQWWAFAVFGLVMSVLIARNYRRRGMRLSDDD